MKSVFIISNTIIHFARQLFTPQFAYSLYGGFLGQCISVTYQKLARTTGPETQWTHFFCPVPSSN